LSGDPGKHIGYVLSVQKGASCDTNVRVSYALGTRP